MKRIYGILFFLLVFCAGLSAFKKESAKVIYVVDGDTLKVINKANEEMVRLIGIDTSEVTINEKLLRDAKNDKIKQKELLRQGHLASSFVKKIVKKDDIVYLEFDEQKRDKYKRLLAYVYLKNGKMLNQLLIEKGLAKAVDYPPNSRYKKVFWNLTPL